MTTHALAWTDSAPPALQGGAVSFGNFDGVHLGHQLLIRTLKENGTPAIAVTFDPPPVALLNPSALKLPLSTLDERATLLHQAGADQLVILKVEPSLLALSAEAFFEEVIQKQFRAKAVVEGSNFFFGHARGGNTNLLHELCGHAGLRFVEVPVGGGAVSSSRVREALNAGDVNSARNLLGRAYAIQGTVVEGAKRGRTLGVPTANLAEVSTLPPANGVYAVTAVVDNHPWPAVANLGPNPTFGENARKIEIHLLSFSGDLYGKRLSVQFQHRLRDTVPFASLDALKVQLQADIAQARLLLTTS